jgi:AhpD family alkylhydroperoxidase
MTRIKPASPETYETLLGKDIPLIMRVHARRPDRAALLGTFFQGWMVDMCTLPGRLVELVRLRIAFFNQCRSCMAVRYEAGAADGVNEALVCSLERPEEAPDLTDAERAALRYAELMATDHLAITDETYDDLRRFFTEDEIVELGQICAFNVGIGRLAATWDVVDDLPESFHKRDEVITPWGGHEVARVGAIVDR